MKIKYDEGLRIFTRNNWFYISIYTEIFVFNIEIDRFNISFERKIKE